MCRRQRALGGHRVALPLERGGDDDVPGRERLVGLDDLHELADEVVDVLELAVVDVEGVAAEARALREDARRRPPASRSRSRRRSCTSGCGCSGRPTPGPRRRRGSRRSGRAASTSCGPLGARGSRSRRATRAAAPGTRPPRPTTARSAPAACPGAAAARSWHSLGSVVGVEQLPALLVEVAPRLGRGRDRGRRLPALVPDRPRAEHRVELRLLAGRRVRVVEAVARSSRPRAASACSR